MKITRLAVLTSTAIALALFVHPAASSASNVPTEHSTEEQHIRDTQERVEADQERRAREELMQAELAEARVALAAHEAAVQHAEKARAARAAAKPLDPKFGFVKPKRSTCVIAALSKPRCARAPGKSKHSSSARLPSR